MSIYSRFTEHARSNGLILAPGGGAPGRETRNSPIFGRIAEASMRLDGYANDLRRGKTIVG